MLLVANMGHTSPADLAFAIELFLNAVVEAGWKLHMHPKFHWLIHLPGHLKKYGCLPTCWVHERKHRVAKRYGTDATNLGDARSNRYEKTILGALISHNLSDLSEPGVFDLSVGLVLPRKVQQKLLNVLRSTLGEHLKTDDCLMSNVARILPASTCQKQDVVLFASTDGDNYVVGEVWVHVQIKEMVLTLINSYTVHSHDVRNGAVELDTNPVNLQFVETRLVLTSVLHTNIQDGRIRILVPWVFRQYKPVNS